MSTPRSPEGLPLDPEKLKIYQTGIVAVPEEVDDFNAPRLKDDIQLAMMNGHKEVTVDFSLTEGIGSAGFGVILHEAERGQRDENDIKSLRIAGASGRLRQLIDSNLQPHPNISIADPLPPHHLED